MRDKLRHKADWAFVTLVDQLEQDAVSEAAYDLFQLYHGDIDTWSFLKNSLAERFLTPQQRVLVDSIFKVSQSSSLEDLASKVLSDVPIYIKFSVSW